MPDHDAEFVEIGPTAEDLGRSYEAMLDQQEEPPAAEPEHRPTSLTPPEPEAPPPPHRIVEAMLFLGGQPLSAERACEIVRGLDEESFHQAIDVLNQEYRSQNRPYTIRKEGVGYLLALRPGFRSVLEGLYGSTREANLSQIAVDVLALVAYRQPTTKQEVDTFRGAESSALLRQLVRRNLIAVVQRGDAEQKEVAYGTTSRFLEFFGLKSLEDLPRTEDLQQI
jgi:segregation and condensation protein B